MEVNISRIQSKIKKNALADCGQSMTEYALLCALVAFGATAGYRGLAIEVGVAYTHVSSLFTDAFGSEAAVMVEITAVVTVATTAAATTVVITAAKKVGAGMAVVATAATAGMAAAEKAVMEATRARGGTQAR